ncbi:MAG: hypothetical protein M3450_02625 [Actinomycetota bacterium]|nr:hypothetical protein [Actinomycetota bacterium]
MSGATSTTPDPQGLRYLLFAGLQQPPNGGLGDLVDTFTSEEAARLAFRQIRLRTSSTNGWAQLAVVDGEHGLKPLCWFGIGARPERYRPVIDLRNNGRPGRDEPQPSVAVRGFGGRFRRPLT